MRAKDFVLENHDLTTAQTLAKEMHAEVQDLIDAHQGQTHPHHIQSLETRIEEIKQELASLGYKFDIPTGRLEQLDEIQLMGRVKGKGHNVSQLPRYGRHIPPEEKEYWLGKSISRFGKYEIWRQFVGGQISYSVYDTEQERSTLTVFGSRYPDNPNSFIISGLYASDGNDIRASEFYSHLILDLGLTLISDRKQSPGGQKVWQELERKYKKHIKIFGYNTRTGDLLNVGAEDTEMTTVPSHIYQKPAAGMKREIHSLARDIRLVATKK